MKKHFLTFLFLLTLSLGLCQSAPVDWTLSAERQDSSHYLITVTAKIAPGWYVYADSDAVNQLGAPEISWDNEHIIKSKIKRTGYQETAVFDKIFKKRFSVYQNSFAFTESVLVDGAVPPQLKIIIHGFAANGKEFQPLDETRTLILDVNRNSGLATTNQNRILIPSVDIAHPKLECGKKNSSETKNGFLNLFFLGFLGGLIALLTPCVFPMIPVTVSFFTNKSRSKQQGIRNGLLYGLCILVIYLVASLPFHLIGHINPEILNSISTNAWVNLIFFLIFIFFALSFFGVFEITLPSAVVNKTDAKSGITSVAGIFFMALTLATVSFSCTGPILGSLLVGSISASSGPWQLTAGLGGFGLALALPFAIFAMFPEWLKKLPGSGGWLDTVKKVLAFVELALAFKFLSNADLVMHWGILKREIFIGIWMLIAFALGLYLLGLFSKEKMHLSVGRSLLGILVMLFGLYLVPGLTNTMGNNLKLLSGFAPPLSYSIYKNESPDNDHLKPDFINDYEGALKKSRAENKPLLIDFTGWACVNCRKMEEQVWTSPEISNIIRDHFILVSLYVDDRKKLDPSESFIYKTKTGTDKEIMTVGDKWATFQSENFGQVTQPMYVILNSRGELMNLPVGYTPGIRQYKTWLECGLNAQKEMSHE